MVPPLIGAAGSLDLNSLGTTFTTFTLEADVSGVDKVQGAIRQKVVERLMIDPRWRVVDEGGTLIAYQRVADGGSWFVPYAGFHRGDSEAWRIAVRCGKRATTDVWMSAQVAHTAATSPSIKIQSFHPRIPRGWSALAASWDGKECALEVYEAQASNDLDLTHTVDAISTIPQHLATLSSGPDYSLPRGEPAITDPKVTIKWRDGQLDVRARVHPSSAGVTWVRLLDEKGVPWEEKAVGTGTRERVGWSADPRQMFFLQGAVPAPFGPAFSGTAEVWHQAPGGVAVKLHSVPVSVPARDAPKQ